MRPVRKKMKLVRTIVAPVGRSRKKETTIPETTETIADNEAVNITALKLLAICRAVTALQIARSFKAVMLTASLSAMVSVVSGIVVSFFLDLPTGATIVLINFIFFLTGLTYRRIVKA